MLLPGATEACEKISIVLAAARHCPTSCATWKFLGLWNELDSDFSMVLVAVLPKTAVGAT
jgi:hypothetical protein